MHCTPPPLFYCMLYQHTVTQWNSLQIRDPALNIQSQMVRRDAFEVHLLPGVNGDVSPLTTCDQINQNANKTRCKGASVWKTVSLFPIPQDAGRWVKPLTRDKQKSPHSKRRSHCLLSRRQRQMDWESPCASHISIFDHACSSPPKITPIPHDLICARSQRGYSLGENHKSRPHETRRCPIVALWLLWLSPILLCISQN